MTTRKKKRFPFGKGKDWRLNIWRGDTYDFASYGIGYFDAGNFLAKEIIGSGGAPGDVALEVAIYPILYLYRQATELMLKHFIYDKPNAALVRGNHNLESLWKQARFRNRNYA